MDYSPGAQLRAHIDREVMGKVSQSALSTLRKELTDPGDEGSRKWEDEVSHRPAWGVENPTRGKSQCSGCQRLLASRLVLKMPTGVDWRLKYSPRMR